MNDEGQTILNQVGARMVEAALRSDMDNRFTHAMCERRSIMQVRNFGRRSSVARAATVARIAPEPLAPIITISVGWQDAVAAAAAEMEASLAFHRKFIIASGDPETVH